MGQVKMSQSLRFRDGSLTMHWNIKVSLIQGWSGLYFRGMDLRGITQYFLGLSSIMCTCSLKFKDITSETCQCWSSLEHIASCKRSLFIQYTFKREVLSGTQPD